MSVRYRPGNVPQPKHDASVYERQVAAFLRSELLTIAKAFQAPAPSTTTTVVTETASRGGGSSVSSAVHNLLSATHPDTVVSTLVRGGILRVNSSLFWEQYALGASGTYLGSDGSDALWSSPAAITKTDDTNVTLTLTGTPASSVFAAVLFTLGWTGTLADARLSTTAVTPGSYGSATMSPSFTVGATGRLTAAANILITPAASSITGGQILSTANDTNITLTAGGSAATALLAAASITAGWTGTLAATRGGTGFGSYAVGDILYADTTTTLAKLADVATGNALISGGVGVAPSWGKIGLTTHVSGTLGVGNGGTGTATTFTLGSVVFAGASGVYTQDNANFFWDDTNNRLGLGTTSPSRPIDIEMANAGIQLTGVGGTVKSYGIVSSTSGHLDIQDDSDSDPIIRLSGTDASFQVSATGGSRLAQYLRVGSLSAPTNTTTGDTTTTRLIVGNSSITQGQALFVVSTNAETASGPIAGSFLIQNLSPAADSSAAFNALFVESRPAGAFNYATAVGQSVYVRGNTTGTITNVIALDTIGYLQTAAITPGNITNVYGARFTAVSTTTATGGTITSAYGVRVINSAATGLVATSTVGIAINDQTLSATNNTNLLVGSSSIPTGAWSIFNTGTKVNYHASNTSFGSTTAPTHMVEVTGATLTTTYLRVGSLTSPNNTTAGDATVSRLSIGNKTFGTSSTLGVVWESGVAPTAAFPTDAIQMWAGNRGAIPNTSGLNIRAEGGTSYIFGDRVGLGTLTPTYYHTSYRDNTSVAPQFAIEQDGSGDANLLFSLTGGAALLMGIDTTDSKFKISNSDSDLSTNTWLSMPVSGGLFGFRQTSPTAVIHIGTTTTEGHLRMDGIAGNPGTPTAGDFWYNTTAKGHRLAATLGTQGISSMFFNITSNSSDITNSSAENDFTNGQFLVPANSLTAGESIRITCTMTKDHDNTAPNLTIRLKWGTTTISSVVLTNAASSTTNDAVYITFLITVRTGGASGVVQTDTFWNWFDGSAYQRSITITNTTAIDFTAATFLKLSGQWNAAVAAHKVRIHSLVYEILNSVS